MDLKIEIFMPIDLPILKILFHVDIQSMSYGALSMKYPECLVVNFWHMFDKCEYLYDPPPPPMFIEELEISIVDISHEITERGIYQPKMIRTVIVVGFSETKVIIMIV